MERISQVLFTLLIVSTCFTAIIEAAHLRRREKYLEAASSDPDPLLDAYYLHQIIEFCKENPERCNEVRLAKVMYRIEGKSQTQKAQRRSKRSAQTGLLFLLNRSIMKTPDTSEPTVKINIPGYASQ